MVTFEEVAAYLENAEWRQCTFTVFNNATDNGWVMDVRNELGEVLDIDDVEFTRIPLDEETKTSLSFGSRVTLSAIKSIVRAYNDEHYPQSAMNFITDIKLLYVIRKKS